MRVCCLSDRFTGPEVRLSSRFHLAPNKSSVMFPSEVGLLVFLVVVVFFLSLHVIVSNSKAAAKSACLTTSTRQ